MDMDGSTETLPVGESPTARERVKVLCLEKCDEMTCDGYVFPERVSRANWVALGLATAGAGLLAWAGFLF